MTNVLCRVASEADITYIVDLQNKNREAVGFLPKMAINERLERNRVFLGNLNGEPFGYLLFDRNGNAINILQAAIQYDARRKLYGAALYHWALAQWNCSHVKLKCAADLESNLFWQSMGLVCVGNLDGGKRRGRKINVWNHFLAPQLFKPEIYIVPPIFQVREDCKYDDTGFLTSAPSGFSDGGSLGKLSWRKASMA
jgi:hypothetical protein